MADDPAQQTAHATTDAAQDPLLGQTLHGRFKIVALIARGATARVYRADILGEDCACAFKILDPGRLGTDDPEFRKRFLLDAAVVAKFTHPNTASVLGYGGTDDDLGYVAMEHLEGRSLHRAIREDGPFPEERALHVALQICRSAREAHAAGIIHRDLRPSNIFLIEHEGAHDFVKVLDYGLVRNANEGTYVPLESTDRFLGSPKYMSPEQIQGRKFDQRTDIYSLGVVLYEMLTGKVPFDRPNLARIMEAHGSDAPPPLREAYPEIDVSVALEDIVYRCLQKAPELRFESMEQLISALKFQGSAVADIADDSPAFATRPAAIAPPSSTPPATSEQAERIAALLKDSDGAKTTLSVRNEQDKKKGPQGILALVAGAALVVGLAAVAAFAMRQADAPIPGLNPAADDKSASVRVESSPEGATVRGSDGRTLCAATPCNVPIEAGARDGRRIVISKDGFREESRTVRGNDGKVQVKLSPVQP
jgi:eukaryotic-like serine/threonine-protein kinase